MTIAIDRRTVLNLLASTSLLPLAPVAAQVRETGFDAIILCDIHSAHERMAQLLAVIEVQVAAARRSQIILVNGDLFETGNVVGKRSGGAAEWSLLAALARLAPTVINIGNHEPDFDNDLVNFVSRAQQAGLTVLSNIIDRRTGKPYAQAGVTLDVGGQPVRIAALATDALNTYPKPAREALDIPEPTAWAKTNLPGLIGDGSTNIVLSHAGVVPDRTILPLLPDGTLLIGGHDHLILEHAEGETRYVHTGSWATTLTIAEMDKPGQAARIRRIDVDRSGPASPLLAAEIELLLKTHLTAEERATIGKTRAAMTLGETGRFAAQAIAARTGADIGLIGHTTLGTGLPGGGVSWFDFNAAVRFDGKITMAQVDAATLADILSRCNQDGDVALEARTGDFLYAAPTAATGRDHYLIACNDWAAINAKAYFGRNDLTFAEVPDLKLKALVAEALDKA